MIILYVLVLLILGVIVIYCNSPKNNVATPESIERDILITYSNEIDEIMSQLKNNPPKEELLYYYKRLAKIYHNGIDDKYIQGNLVKGIKPDPRKAIDMYRTIGMMDDLSVLLDWASIHHWGIPGFEDLEDHKKASEIYLHLYYKSDDIYQKQLAKDHLESLGIEIEIEICVVPTKKDKKREKSKVEKVNKEYIPQSLQRLTTNRVPKVKEPVTQQIKSVEIKDDKHNVHDNVLVKTVTKAVETIKNNTKIIFDAAASIRDIRNYINNSSVSQDRKTNAILALDKIESNNELVTSSKIKEMDLLHLVWNRIYNDINKNNIDVLKENLVDELSEVIEHGKSVCVTGRFNRIIDTLNGVDPEISIKPKWALQKEMVEKAGVLFQEYINKLSPLEKSSFESLDPSPEQEKKNEELVSKIKSTIKENFIETYVKDGIMTEESLNAELNKWIDTIV